uniref:Protein E8^E2C n=1 Tax=Mops bat papillomavirus TaxID=3141892 RepID=A0AAU7E301_9PAPI
MVLVLQSLASSRYAQENWSRRETSREMYEAEPQFCFMKGGSTVSVRWDGDKNNMTEYAAWDSIYCQNETGAWEKHQGMLDYHGLFYHEDNIRIYFHSFDEDAEKYSESKYWEVYYRNKLISSVHPPVHTSTSSLHSSEAPPQQRKRPLEAEAGPTTPSKKSRGGRGGGGVGRGRGRSLRRRHTASPQTSTPAPSSGGPSQGAGAAAPRFRSRGRQSGVRRGGLRGVAASEVGTVHTTAPTGHRSRVQALLDEARDPPLLVFSGEANRLKCYRYRLAKKHHGLFTSISTNFKWAEGIGQGLGSRMLVAFENQTQRKAFQEQASLPPSIKMFKGEFQSY